MSDVIKNAKKQILSSELLDFVILLCYSYGALLIDLCIPFF